MKRILRYVSKYWYVYLVAVVCLVISVSLDMLSPRVMKKIVDDVIIDGEMELLKNLLFIILMIGLGRAIFQYVKEFLFDFISSKITVKLRKDLFDHIQSLSVDFFDKNNTGEIMSRVKDDIDHVWNCMGFIGMLIIEITVHTSLVMYSMISLNLKLAVIPIVTMPLMGFLAIYMEKKLGKVYGDISEENAKLNTVAQENIAGVRTVKAFAREKFEISKFLSHNKKYYDLNMKQSKVFIKYNPIFQFITRLLPITIVFLGGSKVINGEMSLGTLTAFVAYCDYIVWPMEMLGWLSNEAASGIASAKKIEKIFNEKPVIKEIQEPVILNDVKGDVVFDKVSLSLGNNSILKDISFKLKSGKTLGIMGATGAGKTSIINLLNRFYDCDKGKILIDGVDIKDLSIKQLRGSIAPVMQDVFLFSDTINENVKLGDKDMVTDDVVKKSLEQSQSTEFVSRMEDGFETLIGERGVGLSGGQKQRLSIARALAKKAPILFLDDSTSALDMETELAIQKELNSLSNTTKIIIAHRISAVCHADEIIILSEGKIAERGNHEQLMKKRGLYYDIYMAQYGAYFKYKTQTATI